MEKLSLQDLLKQIDLNKISVTYNHEKSLNGFTVNTLKSALQKYIRRGNIDMAIYSIIELFSFYLKKNNFSSRVSSIMTNVMHRLQVIFLEDIGLPGINEWKLIDELVDVLNKKNRDKIELDITLKNMINIVYIMAKSNHSRSCSHYNSFYTNYENKNELKEIKLSKDYKKYVKLVDKNKNNEIIDNFKRSINNIDIDMGFWARRLDENNLSYIIFDNIKSDYVELARKWYNELKTIKEKFLPYIYIILEKYCNKKEIKIDKISLSTEGKNKNINLLKDEEILSYFKKNLEIKLTFDNFIYDIHTKEGDKASKTIIKFVKEGSFVNNEWIVKRTWKDFYNYTKLLLCRTIKDNKTECADTIQSICYKNLLSPLFPIYLYIHLFLKFSKF